MVIHISHTLRPWPSHQSSPTLHRNHQNPPVHPRRLRSASTCAFQIKPAATPLTAAVDGEQDVQPGGRYVITLPPSDHLARSIVASHGPAARLLAPNWGLAVPSTGETTKRASCRILVRGWRGLAGAIRRCDGTTGCRQLAGQALPLAALVFAGDQCQLFAAGERLNRQLTAQSGTFGIYCLGVHNSHGPSAARISRRRAAVVLPRATGQVVGDASVKRAVGAAQNIDQPLFGRGVAHRRDYAASPPARQPPQRKPRRMTGRLIREAASAEQDRVAPCDDNDAARQRARPGDRATVEHPERAAKWGQAVALGE